MPTPPSKSSPQRPLTLTPDSPSPQQPPAQSSPPSSQPHLQPPSHRPQPSDDSTPPTRPPSPRTPSQTALLQKITSLLLTLSLEDLARHAAPAVQELGFVDVYAWCDNDIPALGSLIRKNLFPLQTDTLPILHLGTADYLLRIAPHIGGDLHALVVSACRFTMMRHLVRYSGAFSV